MSKFKKLDFISQNIGYEIDGSLIYKTNVGAVVTCLIVIGSCILSFMIGKEIYERKVPQISSSKSYLIDSKFELGKELPVFFAISDVRGNFIADYEKYITPIGYKFNRTNSKTSFVGELYESSKCEAKHFKGFEGKIPEAELKALLNQSIYICFNLDSEALIQNAYAYTNSSYINFGFRSCDQSKSNNKCAKDLQLMLKEFYVRFFFLSSYVNSEDYYSPIKYFVDVLNQQVSFGSLKRNYFRFLRDEFISDNGWLLENKQHINFISFKDSKLEINSPSPSYPNDLYWVTLESPQVRNVYLRNYIKVQDLFAKVGGIINAFIVLAKITCFHYLRYRYLMDVFSELLKRDNCLSEEVKLLSKNNNSSISNSQSGNNFVMLNNNYVADLKQDNPNTVSLSNQRQITTKNKNEVFDEKNSKLKSIEPTLKVKTVFSNTINLTNNDNAIEKKKENNIEEKSSLNLFNFSKVHKENVDNFINVSVEKDLIVRKFSKINYFTYICFCSKSSKNNNSFMKEVIKVTTQKLNFFNSLLG